MIRSDDYGNRDENGNFFAFYGSMIEVLVDFCLESHCLCDIMLLIPNDYRRADARPPSPIRAAAGCCTSISIGAAPVLMDEALVPVPVTLPLTLPVRSRVTLPFALLLAFLVTMPLVSPVALALLVATASTEAAVIVNVAFHAVQV
jgi:hypothetical protein